MARFALKAHALRDLEACDDAPLDVLAGLPGIVACSPVFPPSLIEVGAKSIALDECGVKEGGPLFNQCREISRYVNLNPWETSTG